MLSCFFINSWVSLIFVSDSSIDVILSEHSKIFWSVYAFITWTMYKIACTSMSLLKVLCALSYARILNFSWSKFISCSFFSLFINLNSPQIILGFLFILNVLILISDWCIIFFISSNVFSKTFLICLLPFLNRINHFFS